MRPFWMALNFRVFSSEINASFCLSFILLSQNHVLEIRNCLEVGDVLERYENDKEDKLSLAKRKPTDEQSRQHIVPTRNKVKAI